MGLYGRVGLLVLFSVFLLHACGTGVEMYHKFGPEHVAVDGKGGMGLELQSSCPAGKRAPSPILSPELCSVIAKEMVSSKKMWWVCCIGT